jgi:hypothetical protein
MKPILREPWALALTAAAALDVIGALGSRHAASQAWLLGFVFVSGFPLGALALLMIGRLTGGRWVLAFEDDLRRLAAWTPWLFLLIAPVLIAPALAFRWAADPAATPEGLKPYLSPWFFALRSLIALAVWSGLGWTFGRGRPGPVAAGVGLILHGLVLVIIPNDWMLSNRPGWTTSVIAMVAAAGQILSAAALVLILRRAGPQPASADLAGFVAAMTLAVVYLGFMGFLVVWYGDLPERNGFFLARRAEPWTYAPTLATALGIATLAVMGLDGGRFGRGRFAWAAWLALAGWLVFLLWLMGADLVPAAPALLPIALVAQIAWLVGPIAWQGRPAAGTPRHA